jgi:hypothetical protein
MNRDRNERLQIMLSPQELAAIDDWRFKFRMPSRASAVRELLRRGLIAEGVAINSDAAKSSEYGVLPQRDGAARKDGDAR